MKTAGNTIEAKGAAGSGSVKKKPKAAVSSKPSTEAQAVKEHPEAKTAPAEATQGTPDVHEAGEEQTAATTPDEEAVDEKLIDEAVEFINATAQKIDGHQFKIGEYLLKSFYDGDINAVSDKNPKKKKSLSALLERKNELPFSKSKLSRMLNVAAQDRFLKAEGVDTDGLSFNHRVQLLRLENGDDAKIGLIESCIENKWSVRELREEVTDKLNAKEGDEGLFPDKEFSRIVNRIEGLFGELKDEAIAMDEETLKGFRTQKLRRLYTEAKKAREQVEGRLKLFATIEAQILKVMEAKKIKLDDRPEGSEDAD